MLRRLMNIIRMKMLLPQAHGAGRSPVPRRALRHLFARVSEHGQSPRSRRSRVVRQLGSRRDVSDTSNPCRTAVPAGLRAGGYRPPVAAPVRGLPDLPRPLDDELVCGSCGHARRADGIRLLDPAAPGHRGEAARARGLAVLAREQGWYEADDRIDAALPFLNRDLGWDDRAWGATETGSSSCSTATSGRATACSRSARRKTLGVAAPRPARLRVRRLRPRRRPADRTRSRRASSRSASAPYLRIQADGERLPFADASFDVAFCVATLHHAIDLRAMVGRARPGHPPRRHRRRV